MKKFLSVLAFVTLGIVAYWAPSAIADSPAVGWSTGGGGGSSVTLPVTAGNGGTGSSANTGASGTLLRGDGDSYESTTFTIPGTIASGTIFRASSANVLAATAYTLPSTAGTSGNVLTSDGTNFVSSAPATGGLGPTTPTIKMNKQLVFANNAATAYTTVGTNTTVTVTTAGGSVSSNHTAAGQWLLLSTGTTANQDAGFATGADVFRIQTSGGTRIWFKGMFENNSTNSCRNMLGVSAVPATSIASANATVNHAIFRYDEGASDSTWKTITNDNSGTGQIIDTGVAIGTNTPRTFCIDMSTPTAITFYIDGVLVATHNATNDPATNTDMAVFMNDRHLSGASFGDACRVGQVYLETY